jgi:hypothetical protein
VIVEAGYDVGAPADERLQRLRAAGEILQVDVEPFVLVEAQLLGQRRRQVDHLVLAADGEADLHAVALRTAIATDRRRERKEREEREDSFQYFHRSSHRSSRVTAALAMTTTIARTVMPAKTPVVSNVPSAWEIT